MIFFFFFINNDDYTKKLHHFFIMLPLFLGPVCDSVGHSFAILLQLLTEPLPVIKVGSRVGQLHLRLRVVALKAIIVFLELTKTMQKPLTVLWGGVNGHVIIM